MWAVKDSFVLIGDVGKLLVDYRHYKGKYPKGPKTLTSKRDLEKYLTENKATLAKQ